MTATECKKQRVDRERDSVGKRSFFSFFHCGLLFVLLAPSLPPSLSSSSIALISLPPLPRAFSPLYAQQRAAISVPKTPTMSQPLARPTKKRSSFTRILPRSVAAPMRSSGPPAAACCARACALEKELKGSSRRAARATAAAMPPAATWPWGERDTRWSGSRSAKSRDLYPLHKHTLPVCILCTIRLPSIIYQFNVQRRPLGAALHVRLRGRCPRRVACVTSCGDLSLAALHLYLVLLLAV